MIWFPGIKVALALTWNYFVRLSLKRDLAYCVSSLFVSYLHRDIASSTTFELALIRIILNSNSNFFHAFYFA